MSMDLKNEITLIQIQFLKAIKSHQACYERLKDGGDSIEINDELQLLQTLIRECQERQKTLLEQLKKESGQVYQFGLYKIPVTAEKGKKRRRKDLSLPVKSEKKRSPTPTRLVSPSPPSSPLVSSDSLPTSEESEDDDIELSQFSLPIPLPMARPGLLANGKNLPISKYARSAKHESRRSKLVRNARLAALKASDEELFQVIPNIPEPPRSPEPNNEHEAKLKFMAALNLVPIESLPELLIRKTERKRRSTANAQFVYNDDWEYPLKRKNKQQYLSPVKSKISIIIGKSPVKFDSPSVLLERCDNIDKKKTTSSEKMVVDAKKSLIDASDAFKGATNVETSDAKKKNAADASNALKVPADDNMREAKKASSVIDGGNGAAGEVKKTSTIVDGIDALQVATGEKVKATGEESRDFQKVLDEEESTKSVGEDEGSLSTDKAQNFRVFENGDSDSQYDGPGCPRCGLKVKRSECTDCGELFHARCSAIPRDEQSFLICRDCRIEKLDGGQLDKKKMGGRLRNCSGPMNERFKARENLLNELCSKMEEKVKLEKRVLLLAESLALQNKLKKELILETEALSKKTDSLRNLIISFQKGDGKERPTVVSAEPVTEKNFDNEDDNMVKPQDDIIVATPTPLQPSAMDMDEIVPDKSPSVIEVMMENNEKTENLQSSLCPQKVYSTDDDDDDDDEYLDESDDDDDNEVELIVLEGDTPPRNASNGDCDLPTLDGPY